MASSDTIAPAPEFWTAKAIAGIEVWLFTRNLCGLHKS
jgi:hypothetical protein